MRLIPILCALCAVCAAEVPAPATLSVLSGVAGAGWAGAAELLARALREAGAGAALAPRPSCAAPPDSPRCLRVALAALRRGDRVALALPVAAGAAGPLARRLRDQGLADLGDVAPPARRLCVQLGTPAALDALAHLTDPLAAAALALSPADLLAARTYNDSNSDDEELRSWCSSESQCVNGTVSPPWCAAGARCAHALAGDAHEARVLWREVRAARLHVRVTALGTRLPATAHALHAAGTSALACGWQWQLPRTAATLAPPLCAPLDLTDADAECPFETRRLVKLAHEVTLARSARVARVLDRFWLDESEIVELGEDAERLGAAAAATRWEERLGARWAAGAARRARVAALVPPGALAVAAAAALAEEHLEDESPLKVQVSEAGCSGARLFRVAADALGGGEYGALSALAGPACGAAGRAAGSLGAAFRLPALAYTPTAPAPAGWRLLVAGDAAQQTHAAAAVLKQHGWRRLVLLSDGAPLDTAPLGADVLAHVELPAQDDDAPPDDQLIEQWARRAAALDARILVVSVSNAGALHAALCAGARAGLHARAGVVWLLLAPPALALRHAPPCAAAATDHLLALHWHWPAPPPAWRAHLARHCARLAAVPDAPACEPDARAALLYDALRLWARALHRLRLAHPTALDDLHDPDVARHLFEYATTMNYTGITGPFEWEFASEEVASDAPGVSVGRTRARRGTLLVTQWRGGDARRVARWTRGRLQELSPARWLTPDGRTPSDGTPACALAALGSLLGSCGAALGAAAAMAATALLGALGGAALYGKRRLEQRFRLRLAALARAPPHRADRWELPRPHVVINRRLGVGAFGTVYGGHARLGDGDRWTAVAVKMLRPGASTDEKLDFLAEAEAMKRLEHPNVVRLLGVVTRSEPVCCVMEFLLHGDLKGYLQARRAAAAAGDSSVSAARLTGWARDAARALSYLATRRMVHRDVAARNCLLSARGTLKLADFGMARCVEEREYYRLGRRGLLPVRWLAPEALAGGVFSPASDVWALGVLLLEIVTFGALPYAPLDNRQVLARVAQGGSPPLPPGIQPPLAGLLAACWARSAAARPGAADVAAWLAQGDRLLAPCLSAPDMDVAPDVTPLAPDTPDAKPDASGWWSGSAGTDCTYLSETPPNAPLLP